MVHILEKYHKNGKYVKTNYTFKRKGIKFWIYVTIMRFRYDYVDIVEE